NVCDTYNIDYELENYLFLPSTHISKNHLLVESLESVVEKLCEKEVNVKAFEATYEAPFFYVYMRIPTIICGPGTLEQAHVVDEFVEVQQVTDASKIFINLELKILESK